MNHNTVNSMSISALSGSLRLLFESLQALHAAELFEPLSDPRVWEFIGKNPYPTVNAVAGHFAHMAAGPPARHGHERWINYAVRSRAQGIVLGTLQATVVDRWAEVAFLFGPRYWGQGYATEAMSAFQEYLRHSAPVEEFWATTHPQNARS
ncbi:MAG TPA: GNAT family N-acetyltransferase, partial [Planctomycetaceae bacterium]